MDLTPISLPFFFVAYHRKMQGSSETAGAAIGAAAAGGTVMAAAANQTGMPDVVAGVEDTPESRVNEKASSGSMDEKLRQGGDISAKTKQEQGKLSTTSDQSLQDLDNRVDRKMQDGNLDSLNKESVDKLGKKDEMGFDKGKDFDDGRTETDLTDLGDPGDLDEWLAGEVLPAEVAVDEGGALQATLALEEELKQAVNAGAIKTLQEVEAEELEEALKEEDSRLKKYWKKFTVFGIIVAIVVGVSSGLTRGKAKNLTFMELEDICNYTNTRAPWLRSAVSMQTRLVCSFWIILLYCFGSHLHCAVYLPLCILCILSHTGTSRRREGIPRHSIQRRHFCTNPSRLCHVGVHVLRRYTCRRGRALRRRISCL